MNNTDVIEYLLVIIDMQNVYLENEPWGCVNTSGITKNIIKLINRYDHIVFTKYVPSKDPKGCWRDYNNYYNEINQNDYFKEIIDPLKAYTLKYPCLEKSTYSAYNNIQFKELALKANNIIITGVVSECCVLSTVIDGIDTGAKIIYVKDACSGVKKEFEKMIEKIVGFSSPIHTKLVNTEDLLH